MEMNHCLTEIPSKFYQKDIYHQFDIYLKTEAKKNSLWPMTFAPHIPLPLNN